MSDDDPGVLWRLDVRDRTGKSIKGYPQILTSDTEYVQRLSHWMGKSYRKNLGLTFHGQGCTRGPWLKLDGPVLPAAPHVPDEDIPILLTQKIDWSLAEERGQ